MLYAIYHVVRHIREWPRGTRTTMTFLRGKSAEADIARALFVIFMVVLLVSGAGTYYPCHFGHRCWTMPMMAKSDSKAVLFAWSGIAVWAFLAWLRGARGR